MFFFVFIGKNKLTYLLTYHIFVAPTHMNGRNISNVLKPSFLYLMLPLIILALQGKSVWFLIKHTIILKKAIILNAFYIWKNGLEYYGLKLRKYIYRLLHFAVLCTLFSVDLDHSLKFSFSNVCFFTP